MQCLGNAIPWRKISPVWKAGQIICIERSRLRLPLSVPELIFVGLFHFAPIEMLRSWNSQQIVPAQFPAHVPFFSFSFLLLFSRPTPSPAGFFILFPDGGFPARYSHSGSHPVYTARAALLAASREIISKNICGIDVAIIIAKRMALNCRMRPPHVLPCDESIYIVHYIYIVAGTAGAENLSRREYSKNANYRYCSLFLFILLQVWLAISAVDLSLMYY